MEQTMGKTITKKLLIAGLIAMILLPSLYASVYKTYTRWEIDALFVAWVISRHVEPQAQFIVIPKGSDIEPPFAINTPKSRFRRSGRETAFESALRYYKIHTACTEKLTPIIRILELAPWRKSEDPKVLGFENDIHTILQESNISAAFDYIDHYCKGDKL